MAEAKPAGDEGAPPKKKKLLLFIIIGVLVLVLGGGVAAFLLLKKSNHAEDEEGDEPPAKTARKAKDGQEVPPVFVKLDPFTVKLQTEQQESYLQATPELRVVDPKTADKVKAYTPRHKVLLLMSGKKPSELSSPQGVQKLANEVRVSVNLTIDGPKTKSKKKGKAKEVEEQPAAEAGDQADPDDSVQAVLFTSFIIQ